MHNFENKLIQAEKTLNNIREYLWNQWYTFKVKKIRKNASRGKFLERQNKSQKDCKGKEKISRNIRTISKFHEWDQ